MISEENYRIYLHNYYQRKTDMALTATVRNQEFPGCCGVRVLSNAAFNYYNDYGNRYDSRDATDAQKANALAKYIMSELDPDEYGCYLYTTIASQKVEYNALKMAGFQVVGKFKNPRSGRWVFVHAWFKTPLPSRTRTVRGPRAIGRAATVRPARASAKRRLVRSAR